MPPAYIYANLQESSQIRLIQLHPGSGDDAILISLNIVSTDTPPEYEAISYCWGDTNSKLSVYCNNELLYVTVSLFTALQRFRHTDQPRTLWVDAICIHQADPMEKEQQVLLMPRIYSQATRVLVWLGADDSGLDGIKESIAQAITLLPDFSKNILVHHADARDGLLAETEERRKLGKHNLLDHNWSPLVSLFERPWFTRKWVIQEICQASTAVFVCGGVDVEWQNLRRLLVLLSTSGVLNIPHESSLLSKVLSKTSSVYDPMVGLQNATLLVVMESIRSRASLLDYVSYSAMFTCTDPRDHLYSLLSLPTTSSLMRPDYSKTVEQVFIDFAVTMLVGQQNFNILGLAPHMTHPHIRPYKAPTALKLPSWVPNITGFGTVRSLSSFSFRKPSYSAGGHQLMTPIRVSYDNMSLYCQGRIIDVASKIVSLNAAFPQTLADNASSVLDNFNNQYRLAGFPLALSNWVGACKEFLLEGIQEDVNPEEWYAFGRTMMSLPIGWVNQVPEDAIDTFPSYVERLLATLSHIDTAQHNVGSLRREQHYDVNIEMVIITMAMTRLLCRTEQGRLASVRLETEVGDKFCVLLGAETPFVLRPTGRGTYRLIGACYLDGVMRGETLLDDSYSTEEIVIE